MRRTVLALLTRKDRRACSWRNDAALVTRDGGDDFVAWFDTTTVDDVDAWNYVHAIPLSRTYEVADEARRGVDQAHATTRSWKERPGRPRQAPGWIESTGARSRTHASS